MNRNYLLQLLKNGKRIDGRDLLEFRKIKAEINKIKKAEGSALINIGNTSVIAGVKLSIDEPFKDSPTEGILIVESEFSPVASPEFEPGPPTEDSIELARVVDRGIRESKLIDVEKLCIKEGEKVWTCNIDIHILNNDGNLIDAAFLASVLALKNAKLPEYDIEKDEINRENLLSPLPLKNYFPLMITVCKLDDYLFLDPTYDEEEFLESKVSICVRDDNVITAVQKQNSYGIEFEKLEEIFSIAMKSREKILSNIT